MATYHKTHLNGVVIIEPKVFGDERGYFFESYRESEFTENVGTYTFVQDNESMSGRGVLRGLHYQLPPHAQSKLVRVVKGAVLDVAVDIRKSSLTFGQHVAVELSEENKRQLLIPRGFAHGFLVLSQQATFLYKVDSLYNPASERTIRFDDPALGINWQIDSMQLVLSDKDKLGVPLANATLFD